MADEFNDSNHSSLLSADQYIVNPNPLSSESAFTGSWGSSSSFLNTSFGSEQDSSETDNDDGDEFVAELTRKMADYMLQEDDDDNSYDKYTSPEGYVSQKPVSEVKHPNQNRVTEDSKRGRKGKMTESTQQLKSSSSKGSRMRPVCYGPMTSPTGSGMRAIFLNGPGSKNGSNGTGVFLPRSATDATANRRKKPGCSTVLVPTRVLHALEQHFNNMKSRSPTNNMHHIRYDNSNFNGQRDGMQHKLQVSSTSTDHLERKLPQEWTY
ncbi:unnamed protein product [Lactuca saligna]|uniref:Uncharacterized protein n=1 Tax=Lactuca saligna TaxID=75948 RepID=A0AA36E9V9_LACSI|nr:unnamed protein product [Lactuca saligna]